MPEAQTRVGVVDCAEVLCPSSMLFSMCGAVSQLSLRCLYVSPGLVRRVVPVFPMVLYSYHQSRGLTETHRTRTSPTLALHSKIAHYTGILCVEALRQNAEGAGKARRFRRYPSYILPTVNA